LDQDIIPVLILYGTEYGFSAELAKKLEDEIQALETTTKLFPRVISMEVFANHEKTKN
jgi:flavodoxin